MATEVGRACLDECRKLGFEGALYYGMVKEYADTRGWGVWEVFREFVQNALDEMHEVTGRRPTYYPCKHIPEINGVMIYDTGRGIATYNLYIGKSEKKPWQRGKFGEGLKVALLTATAIGKKVLVRSGDKEFVSVFARELVEGVPLDVFCVCVRRLPSPITGTEVYMYNVRNLCEEFRELVVQGIMERTPDATLVSFESPSPRMVWRDLIDKNVTGGKANIYVRDIFVSSFELATGRDACFSYNLYDVKLDESRRIVGISSVEKDVGTLLLNLIDSFEPEKAETDAHQKRIKETLKSFLKCVIDDCGENTMFESEYPPFPASEISYNPVRKHKMRLLLDEVIGKDAIIIGDRKMSDLLDYLTIPHIYCTTWFGNNAQHWFDLSEIMKKKAQEMESKIVPRDRINPVLRERLEILERIAWTLFEPPSDVRAEYMWAPPEVRGETAGNLIVLNLYHLSAICERYPDTCMYAFISTYGHELAHIISRAGDLTKDFERALTHLLGHSFNNAIKYHETLRSLVTRFYQTYR